MCRARWESRCSFAPAAFPVEPPAGWLTAALRPRQDRAETLKLAGDGREMRACFASDTI